MKPALTRQINDTKSLDLAIPWFREMVSKALRAGPVLVGLGRPKRTNDQNSMLWALLTDLAEQVNWHGQYLTKENWKDVMTAAQKRQAVVPGVDGGFVVLGTSTSNMDKAEMSELIELILAFGAQHDVKWSESNVAS